MDTLKTGAKSQKTAREQLQELKAKAMQAKQRATMTQDNSAEQKRQIEVLWDALKVLRYEAQWHMESDDPHEGDNYARWSGRAWAAYDFIDNLIDQRISLLQASRRARGSVAVGELDTLPAMVPVNCPLPEDHYSGPFFDTHAGKAILIGTQVCDHESERSPSEDGHGHA